MAKSQAPACYNKPKLPLHIGVGTLITVGLALIIGGYSVYQHYREAYRPPIIERQVQGAALKGIAPVPEFLLRHRQELSLSSAQAQKITVIAATYRRDIAPTKRQVDIAAEEYQKYLERAQDEKRPDPIDIDRQGATVRRLSRILATARHSYWKQARAVLTPTQQQQADALAARAISNDLQ
ncbi:MAG: hypothetical protein ACYC7E_18355 [Armatimonadota bacterium]